MEVSMTQSVRSASQLGNLVCEERLRRSLSQRALADLAGLGQKTISQVENGSEGATLETIFRLLAVLNLAISFSPRDIGVGRSVGDVF